MVQINTQMKAILLKFLKKTNRFGRLAPFKKNINQEPCSGCSFLLQQNKRWNTTQVTINMS